MLRLLVVLAQTFPVAQRKSVACIDMTEGLFPRTEVVPIAAPLVVLHLLHQSGRNGVAVDIAQDTQEVALGRDNLGFEATLK